MNRLRRFRMTVFCLAILTAPSEVQAAPPPAEPRGLDQVPASAPIVVHVRGVQGTRDRLVAMMEKALPDVLAKFQPKMDDYIKNGDKGRKLRGLVKDGPIFVVFTELPKSRDIPPKVAFIFAVINYKEFRDNLLTKEEQKNVKENNGVETATLDRETVYFVDRKGYAVVTPNEELAKAFTKKQPALSGKLSKEQAVRLASSDVGVYLDMDALNKKYAEQIKERRQQTKDAYDFDNRQSGNGPDGASEMLKSDIDSIFQAVEDSKSAVLTAEFRPGGLAIHIESEMRQSSPTALWLEDSRPVAFKDLARMPQDRTCYTATEDSPSLLKLTGFMVAARDKDSKEAKVLAKAIEELAK